MGGAQFTRGYCADPSGRDHQNGRKTRTSFRCGVMASATETCRALQDAGEISVSLASAPPRPLIIRSAEQGAIVHSHKLGVRDAA